LVGGLAYATYWLSIPFAGFVIYRLRTRYGATGLVAFLNHRYGRLAASAFTLAILIRLYNEIWSNTAVVGGYFGPPGSRGFIGAALAFTVFTVLYSIKGGLRSSLFTDLIQAAVFVLFLGLVLFEVLPRHSAAALLGAGELHLATGGDLLLVALLQVLSYPFHDPVLTDRGFVSDERGMLRAFIIAGVLGFCAILAFSLVGVHAYLSALPGSDNVPVVVARSLGVTALFVMTVIMMTSAGSTLDSTFASLAKLVGRDLPALFGRQSSGSLRVGALTMVVFAVLGNLPMLAGTDILKATTMSGTMVMGLAPVFLLAGAVQRSPWRFHLAFWPGMALGLLLAVGAIPVGWAVGDGRYALLLGVDFYGLLICTAGFLLPELLARVRARVGRELV